MNLYSYLKQFKSIAWYPSAGIDALSMVCLSHQSLLEHEISKRDVPDCFIFTDYLPHYDRADNHKFILDLDENEDHANFFHNNNGFSATAFNVRELDKLSLSFDPELVMFDHDNYYGRVFTADVLVEHPDIGKTVVKLVYVIAENTAFAFEFLIRKNIKVKYVIHSCYGHSFGGGNSNGGFICNILKELGTKYFASDIDNNYGYDIADKYITGIQRSTLPILRNIVNFNNKYGWFGYDDTILYEIKGYSLVRGNNDNMRFITYEEDIINNRNEDIEL